MRSEGFNEAASRKAMRGTTCKLTISNSNFASFAGVAGNRSGNGRNALSGGPIFDGKYRRVNTLPRLGAAGRQRCPAGTARAFAA
jgi:hypothetical protein